MSGWLNGPGMARLQPAPPAPWPQRRPTPKPRRPGSSPGSAGCRRGGPQGSVHRGARREATVLRSRPPRGRRHLLLRHELGGDVISQDASRAVARGERARFVRAAATPTAQHPSRVAPGRPHLLRVATDLRIAPKLFVNSLPGRLISLPGTVPVGRILKSNRAMRVIPTGSILLGGAGDRLRL